jgi:hypothetical protein
VRVRGDGEPEITVKRAGDGAFAVVGSLATRQGIAPVEVGQRYRRSVAELAVGELGWAAYPFTVTELGIIEIKSLL